MKSFIGIVSVICILSSPAFAAKKKTRVVKTQESKEGVTPTPTPSTVSSSHTLKDIQLSADGGLGTIASRFHFGVAFHAEVPVTIDQNHFTFGGQTGFYLGFGNSTTSWVIPLMATGTYHFQVTGSLKPYAGLGIGISITHASTTLLGVTASATSTDLALMLKPGVKFNNDQNYFEIPFGTMASNFAIIPSVGMYF